jgi:energy-coupling factor transporter ATP-binding protein EcfA2
MAHLKGFGIENFRVFKEATWFDFAPITLLVGPNSSGKSSLNKAIMLLKDLDGGKLNFSTNESIHQLGSFERILSYGSSHDKLVYEFPYRIEHYPSIGDSCTGKLRLEFVESNLYTYSILIDDVIFYRNDSKKIRLNLNALLKGLLHDKDLKVCKRSEILGIIAPNDDYVIINRSNTVKGLEYTFDDGIQTINGIADIPRILYSDKSKEKLNEILEFYQSDHAFNEEQETPLRESETYQVGVDEWVTEDNIGRYIKKPVSLLMRQMGYSESIVEFVTVQMLTMDSVLRRLRYVMELTSYMQGMAGKLKRVYRKEEPDSLNETISTFVDSSTAIKKDFVNKWAGEFKLQGEITPIIDLKYNIQSVDIGDTPLIELGYGISQLTALMLGISNNIVDSENSLIIIEEPEANLHPAFQSKLADFFNDALETFNYHDFDDVYSPFTQFIIETHSEYMVRKFQYLVAKGKMKKEDIVIYYFNDPNNVPKGEKQVKRIDILEDGSLSDDFGTGFFDEAANWELELLRLKNNKVRQS